MKWAQDDPKYQRMLQKMARMSKDPNSAAIFSAAAGEEAWASTNAAKNLRLMQIGNELKNRKQFFQINMDYKKGGQALRKGGLEIRKGGQRLAAKSLRYKKRSSKLANILGLAGVGTSGLLGHKRYKMDLKQAQKTNDLYERLVNRRA